MKTLEFKIYPTVAQTQTIDLWLEQLKWVWNRGLEIRLEAQQRRWREKVVCTLPDSLKLKWKNGKIIGCGVRKTREGYKYCEVRQWRNIENPKKFAQGEFFRSDKIPDWLQDVPSKLKQGVNDALNKAWKAYSDPKHPGRRPKFKGKYDKLKSLLNGNAGGVDRALKPQRISDGNNGYVRFPKLDKLYVKGLFARYNWHEWGSARIIKEPSGYYLQVCVPSENVQLPSNDKAVGIDPGLKSVITTNAGREVAPPKLYRNQQKKLRRLQRKASRQVKGSSNQKKTYHLIARLHEKIRRSRNAFNHKLSTKIVREYGAVAMEDLQIKNLTRKPKAKQRENGLGYEQNGAKRKAGLNKSFADSALGDLISKIESKSKVAGREFVKVPAHYTTINCSQCGEKIKKSLSVRTHRCTCGYVAGRDENAAQNILLKGCELFKQTYRSWEWKRDASLKPVSASETEGQQEAVRAAPEAEYASRSPERGLASEYGDRSREVITQIAFAPQAPSNPLTVTLSLDELSTPTRDPCSESFSKDLENPSKPKNKKKRKPAQTIDENFIQLTLWDFGAETDTGG